MEELAEFGIEFALEVSQELSQKILGETLSSEEYQNNQIGGSLGAVATTGIVASLVGFTAPLSIPALCVAGVIGMTMGSKTESNIKKTTKSFFQQVADFFDNYEDHLYEGIVNLEEENYEEAFASFNRAIELNSECLEAYFHRGCIYTDFENYQEAIDDFNQVIKLDAKFIEAYDYKGHIYAEQNNYKLAIDNYSKSIDFDDTDPDIYFRRACCYLQ